MLIIIIKNFIRILVVTLIFSSVSACVYKIKVQQGNLITQDMVDQLKVGMSMRQVQLIMGNALVRDPFNAKRLNYIDSTLEPTGKKQIKRMVLFFDEQNNLASWQGDFSQGLSKDDALLNN